MRVLVSLSCLDGTLACLSFSVPYVRSRFCLCQVRRLLLALNSRSALAKANTQYQWSVPTLCALRPSD